MKSLFKTVALITVFSIITRVSGFLFRIFLSRTVGAEGVGLYQVASSVFMVLMTVIASGLPLVISRMSATFLANKEKKKEASLVTIAFIFALILSIVLCLLVLLFRNAFSNLFTDARCIEILIVLLPSLVFSSVYCVFRGALWGRGNYFALCITELYEQIIRIILCMLVISSTFTALENALNIGWTMSLACLFSMILVVLLYFYYGGKLTKPQKKLLKPIVRQSTPITLMRIAGSLLQPLIAFIIPARLVSIGYTSSQALSLYGIAVGMTLPLLYIPTTIIGSLSTALVPDISAAVAQNNHKHIEERINTSIFFALIISCLFVPIFLGMGEHLGIFLYDNIMSGTLLQSASWVLIPLGLTNITSALLNSLGLEEKSFVNFLIGAAVMFVALWFLPALIGVNALVWGMGLNYVVVSVMNIWLIKRKAKVNIKFSKMILKMAILIIPSGALTAFIVSLCEYIFPLFITLIIGSIVSITSFVLLTSALNIVDVKAFWVIFQKKIKLPKLRHKRKT